MAKQSIAATNIFLGLRFVLLAASTMTCSSVLAQSVPVDANDQTPPGPSPEAASKEPVNLDTVVVTGTTKRTAKIKSSISVSTVSAEQIEQSQPTNTAEVLRTVPGVRSESSGGEGNANVTVRGVPISAGGTRYVQFQEDGLPVLQFGDTAFATPDSFVRVDGGLDHLEVVRGGSASILATNSPGGIINFISKNGDEKGGSIGFSKGLDFDQNRFDFNYGGPIVEKTRFAVSGYYRNGNGVRDPDVTVENGGQLRFNVTHDFANGYLRLSYKHLDDRAPTNLPVPVVTTNGRISAAPGIDPLTASFYSPYWVRDRTLAKNNTFSDTNVNDGLRVKQDAFGAEAHFDLGQDWSIDNKFRRENNTGRFIGIFPSSTVQPARSFAEFTGTYATGPNAGRPYTGSAFRAVVFNTSLDDLGLTVNDVKLSKVVHTNGIGTFSATAGFFASIQNVSLTWNFNQYLLQATGKSPALLSTGNATPGFVGQAFGGCCERAYDAQYKTSSPYLTLGWELGSLNVDGGVRRDIQHASGTFNQADFTTDQYLASGTRFINYGINHTSYSIGANYRLLPGLAVFARTSDGAAFNADRILFNTFQVDGSTPIPINTVIQQEAGVKWRQGSFSTFVTAFHARTKETNYEATELAPIVCTAGLIL